MVEFEAVVRRVGESLGILIPHRVIEQIHGRPGRAVRIVIPAKVDWSEIWGRLSTEESTDQLIRNARTDRD